MKELHKNYIDCALWYENLIISKDYDNKIYLWVPLL